MDTTKMNLFTADDEVIEQIINLSVWQQVLLDEDLDITIQAVRGQDNLAGFSITDQHGSRIDFLFKQDDPDNGFLLGKAGLSGRLQTLIFEKYGQAPDDQ